jgi:RHS repeat-associated protein
LFIVASLFAALVRLRPIPVAAASNYNTTVLGDAPTAYWRVGEAAGTTMTDATANANNGTYVGGFTLGQAGAIVGDTNTAVAFDGATGAASVPNAASLQVSKISIELWVKKLAETNYGMYVTKNWVANGGAGTGWFQLMNSGTSGRLEFRVTGDSPTALISNRTLALNAWYHVVATYDGSNARLYVNGALDSVLTIAGTPAQTTDPLYVGRRSDGYFNQAVLDEVAIYPSALSAAQVAAHWQAAGYAPAAPTAVTASLPNGTTNQAAVSWTAPAATGTSAITSYTITPHVGTSLRTPVTVSGSPPATSVTIIGLSGGSPGAGYTFTVVAANSSGPGAASAASNAVTVTGNSYPYAGTVLADSPGAYWRFGEASGTTATDLTGNGLNGSYAGGVTLGQPSGLGGGDPSTSVSLNGSSGFVNVVSTPTLQVNTVTLELWLKKVSETNYGMYVTKNFAGGGGPGTSWFQLMNNGTSGRLEFRVTGDVGASLVSNRVLALGSWYDVVATYDGSVAKLYINGALDNVLGMTATPVQTSDPLLIGQRANGYYNNAVLEELAIYPIALTPAQVLAHWSASGVPPGTPTGLTATAGSNQATVSWTAPSAGSSTISGYTITPQVGTTLRTPTTVAGMVTSATVTGLSGGTAYTFSVVASNSQGSGAAAVSTDVRPTGTSYGYASTILSDAPVAYWRLGEAAGTSATDATGNGISGTYAGGFTLAQPGGIAGDPDPAVALNGGSGLVDVKPFPALKPGSAVTVEAWINPTGVPGGAIFASPEQAAGGGYLLNFVNAGHVRMNIAPTTGSWTAADSITVPPAGKWTYVAGSWDGANIRIYVNGVVEATQPAATMVYGATSTDPQIGRYNGASFGGTIDEVAVYSRALTAAQIMAHWSAGGWAPGAPTAVSATSTAANQATVSWTAPASSGASAITGYTVTPRGGPTQVPSVTVTASPATVTGLSGGSSYTFSVIAKNTYGGGPPATSNAVTPAGPALPGAPTGVTATAGNAQATVSWTAPADGGSPITSYTVTPYVGATAQTSTTVSGTPPPTTATVTGLSNNTYTFQVVATNGVGPGPAGVSSAVTISTAPGAPTGVTASGLNQSAAVYWTAPAANGSPITSYTVTTYLGACCGTPASGIAPVTVTTTSTTITGLTKEVSYSFQVSATNANGTGPGGASGVVTPYGPAGPPRNVSALTGSGQAIVSWLPPTDNGGATITSYTITPVVNGVAGTPTTVGTGLTSAVVPALTGGTSYTLTVTANNAAGGGAGTGSNAITVSTPFQPGNPFNSLNVYVGYVQNNQGGPAGFTPTPWNGSPNVNFVGVDPGPPTGMDAGAVRIENTSSTALTLTDVSVTIGSTVFDLWGSAITVPANGSAVLTQTATGNFDTSDVNNTATTNACTQSGQFPAIKITTSGISYTFLDNNQVLNTGGIDRANCTGRGESQQWEEVSGGPSPHEQAGDGPIDERNCGCSSTPSPVNNNTGNFYHSYTDLFIPGRGISLLFSRTYNSLFAGQDGPVGFGWSTTTAPFLTEDVTGNVTVHEENGGTVTFTSVPGQVYQPPSRVLATLVLNQSDGSFTFTRFDKSQLNFSAAGPLISETDRNHYSTTFAYNASGQLTTETDPAGRTLTFAYTSDGRHLLKVSDSTGRSASFLYDAGNNLTQVTDVAGGLTKFTYDANHLLLTITDANLGVVTNTYDTLGTGRVSLQVDPQKFQTQFAYSGNQTTITDPNGNKVVETYQNSELVSRTQGSGTPQAATWSYQYDPVTLGITQITDPNGHISTNKWDASGNLLQQTDPLLRVTSYTYNAFNEVLTAKDPLQVTTTYTYDGNGNLNSVSRPLTGTTQTSTVSYTYGDSGHLGDVTQMTDATGKVWAYAYDQYGNRTQVTDPMSDVTTFTSDALGRMLTKVNPLGNVTGGNPAAHTTTYTYNAFGNVLTTTDPLSDKTTSTYDGNGNQTQLIDANLHKTINTYNLDNQLTQVARADGSVLKTTYDGSGNVLTQVDGLNNATTYTYDPLNRKASMSDADLRKASYGYDGAGNLLTVLDPLGRTTTYGYDTANQLKSISYSDLKTPNVSFTYDSDGQRLSMADGTGTSSYSYDSLHRLTQSTNGASQQVQYGYDLKGHLTSLIYPGGTNAVTRSYDAAGRLSSVADWLNHTTTFGFDADSNLTTESYPNTTVAKFTYDAADRLMGIVDTTGRKNTQFLNFGYSRDAANQLTADNALAYGYDAINRLTTSTAGGSFTYGYDNGDNLTSIAIAASTTTGLAYDVAHQLQSYTKMNGTTLVQKLLYTYDQDGNRITRTDQTNAITSYGWDQANRLTSYTAGSTTASYVYNGDGLRMSKTLSGTAEPFVWDVAEGLPLIIKDGATSYVTGPGGLPLEQIIGTTVNYFHQDQLGSTRALTDSAGATAASYTFDAYGNLTSTPPTLSNPFQFAGQYSDSESALYYLRHRYYEPATGQFISADLLVIATRHAYAYVGNSPISQTDNSGMCFPVCMVVGAVIGAAVGLATYGIATVAQGKTPTWQGVAVAMGSGALAGGIAPLAAFAFGGGVIGAAVGGGAGGFFGGFSGSLFTQAFSGKPLDFRRAITAGVIGGVFGAVGGGLFATAFPKAAAGIFSQYLSIPSDSLIGSAAGVIADQVEATLHDEPRDPAAHRCNP